MPDKTKFDDSFLASPEEMAVFLTLFLGRQSTPLYVPAAAFQHQLKPLLPTIAPKRIAALSKTTLHEYAILRGPSGVPEQSRHRPLTVKRRLYCECGRCRWCLDNARWDWIFSEKFNDPNYYGSLKLRHDSSLAGEA